MAPARAPNTTWISITPASAMPLPTVAATLRWKMKMATKLKKAANTTACPGFRTPVDTTVAIELAASWKPFMKSNTRAMATSTTTAHSATGTLLMWVPRSGVLEDDALDQVGHVLTLVGDGFEQLVDGLELDHLAHIGLFAEQLAHGRAHHAVGVRLQAVDLFAGLEGGFGHRLVGDLVEQLHRIAQAFAALQAQVGQAADLIGHDAHVIQGHGLCRVLDQVGHVVHGVDQRVDLLTVDRGDERLVDQAVDVLGHAVGSVLSCIHVLVVLLTQVRVAVVGHQLGESTRSLHDVLGVLVEHLEKIAFSGQQLAKQHGDS